MKDAIQRLFDLKGKVALVTGGAMGIGSGIALRLAQAGASVVIADIVPLEEAAPILNTISSEGGKAVYIRADMTDTAGLPEVVEKTIDAFGDIDILVNNAGIFRFMPVTELTEELWDKTIGLNLKAVAFLSKAVANEMISRNHGGRIINISSVDSLKPTGNLSAYDASKGGVRMLTRAFAKELGRYGITVNDIAPGGVNTPGVKKIAGNELTPEAIEAMLKQSEQLIHALPLQRMGEPEDIGNAVLFLAGEASSYMTGSTIVVDGGLLLL